MKYNRIKLLPTILILCISSSFAAELEIYKETDASGNVRYTDKPKSATAEKVEVEDVNTMPEPPKTTTTAISVKQGDDGEESSEPNWTSNYTANITFPPENHVVYAGGQDFFVKTTIQPKLDQDFTLLLEHNGQTGKSLKIPKISLGSHTIRVLITDFDGAIVAKSPAVNFLVKARRANKPRYRPQP